VERLSSRVTALKLRQVIALLVMSILAFGALHFFTVRDSNARLDAVRTTVVQGLANLSKPDATPALSQKIMADITNEMSDKNFKDPWYAAILSAIAYVTSLTGIVFAIFIMRATLRRLDAEQRAHKLAAEAQEKAEQIAARFAETNDEMSQLNHELANKVVEIKSMQDEMVKKGRMEQLGQLIATIAHEIRNPLGAIRTSAFLLDRQASRHNIDLSAQVQRINNSVERCDTIISQLLDYSRTKEINADLGVLDDWLAKIIREEAEKLPDTTYIECALGLESVQVAFDPARLRRAIVNLINNASEALSQVLPGNQHVGWRPTITVTTLKTNGFACIRVSDNGPGIPPENLARIREPLFTTKSFGTGLGIPAIEQIVSQHRGRLEITSEVGRGATFIVCLPMDIATLEAA
jgi:signal transduction histidine kinase